MQPSAVVDRAQVGDSEFCLVRRGDEWLVRVDSSILMSSRMHASEEALATEALARVPRARSVLVGGLGLGFSLRAALNQVGPQARVTVVELVPALVAWNREHVGQLAGHPLSDARSEVEVDDVFASISRRQGTLDALLLDVDNGPEALSSEGNRRLYAPAGVKACYRALTPGGVLAVWSAGPSERYTQLLRQAGFEVEVVRPRAASSGRARHVLFIAKVGATPRSH